MTGTQFDSIFTLNNSNKKVEVNAAEENGQKDTTNQVPPPFKILWLTTQQWAENTTFHSVKYVFNRDSNIVRRLFWLGVIGVMWYYTISGCVTQIERYLSYKAITRETVRFEHQLEFPSVSVCSECLSQNNSRAELWEKKLIEAAMESFYTGDLSYSYGNMSLKDIKFPLLIERMSVQANSLFYQCKWLGAPFNCSERMKPNYIGHHCFTFNYKEEPGTFMASTTGSFSGLSMMIFLDQENCYMGGRFDASGVKVLIHDVGEEPEFNKARMLPPGFHHSLGVTKQEKKHLSLPVKAFGETECLDTSGDFQNPLKYFPIYTRQACEQECWNDYVLRACDCVIAILADLPICDFYTHINCVTPVLYEFWAHWHEYIQGCGGCLMPCSYTTYSTQVSPLYIPGRNFKLPPKQNGSRGLDYSDKEYIRENFLSVEVYYDTKMVHVTEQLLEFTQGDLFAAVGGFLGLAVGASILTILELFEMILIAIIRLCRNITNRQ